jgi:hypothetical protein
MLPSQLTGGVREKVVANPTEFGEKARRQSMLWGIYERFQEQADYDWSSPAASSTTTMRTRPST